MSIERIPDLCEIRDRVISNCLLDTNIAVYSYDRDGIRHNYWTVLDASGEPPERELEKFAIEVQRRYEAQCAIDQREKEVKEKCNMTNLNSISTGLTNFLCCNPNNSASTQVSVTRNDVFMAVNPDIIGGSTGFHKVVLKPECYDKIDLYSFPSVKRQPPKLPGFKKIETYNDRVVKVTFEDDTWSKAVCGEHDEFNLDTGVTVCLIKKLLGGQKEGTRGYNKLLEDAHKQMDKQKKEAESAAKQKEAEAKKARKAKLRKAAKALKREEARIKLIQEAIERATGPHRGSCHGDYCDLREDDLK